MEIVPSIHQLKVPLPDNPLGFLNAYLIRDADRSVLVDTGWDTPQAFGSLEQQLTAIGASWTDISLVVVTHVHPDHCGLADKIRRASGAEVVMHPVEGRFIDARHHGSNGLLEEVHTWLTANGVPRKESKDLQGLSRQVLDSLLLAHPDRVVSDGEIIDAGRYRFQVLWTPGHSPGHICLYEPSARVLLSGDHVLPVITPNISLHTQSLGNPLVDYIEALARVSRLAVDIVLPGHEDVFHDLPRRVEQILQHHEERMQAILEAIGDTPRTAYDTAASIHWETGGREWDALSVFDKHAAVTETLAHLEFLRTKGQVRKTDDSGIVVFSPQAESRLHRASSHLSTGRE